MSMIWVDLIGYAAGIFTLINMIPQILKTYKLKSVEDVSIWLIVSYSISMILWVIYAWFIVSWPIIITNGIAFFLSLIMLALIFKYKKK